MLCLSGLFAHFITLLILILNNISLNYIESHVGLSIHSDLQLLGQQDINSEVSLLRKSCNYVVLVLITHQTTCHRTPADIVGLHRTFLQPHRTSKKTSLGVQKPHWTLPRPHREGAQEFGDKEGGYWGRKREGDGRDNKID